MGKFQVGGIPLQEIRWGAYGIERFYDDEMLLMGRRQGGGGYREQSING